MRETKPLPTDSPFILSETRHQRLLRLGQAVPKFLQGLYPFAGKGIVQLTPLNDDLRYVVPEGATAEVIYFRAGNFADELLYLTISANGIPVRYFPVAPHADVHVPLAIVEPYPAGTVLEISIAAARMLTGSVVVDVGLIEVSGPI